MNKGFFFNVYSYFKFYITRILWNSQKKRFKKICKGSSVLELPYIQGYENIIIGKNFHIGKDIRMEAWTRYGKQRFNPRIIIGDNVTMTGRCYISCIDYVRLGNNVLIGRDVFITDNSHGDTSFESIKNPPIQRNLTSKGAVYIGDNVWIGRQSTILSGVKIGKNSIVGAHSLVIDDVPDNVVVCGCPARIIKEIKNN